MASMEITQEMRAKLIRAKDQEEVRAILGPEAAEDEIGQIWREIEAHRPADGLETVDDDELDAVSGGGYDRNYGTQGCADTTKDGWCWSADKCSSWTILYGNYDPCPKGGNHKWKFIRRAETPVLSIVDIYKCEACGESKNQLLQ